MITLHPAVVPVAAVVAGGGALLLLAGRRDRAIAARITEAYPAAASIADAIVDVADEVGCDPFALANLINFESAFNPGAVNPSGGASGLIQFMPATAASLGTTVGAIRGMSAAQQMPLVQRYLGAQKETFKVRSLRAPHKLAMAVFYPKAMRWPSWAMFPWRVIRSNGWRIFTPGDYLDRLEANAKLPRKVGLLVSVP